MLCYCNRSLTQPCLHFSFCRFCPFISGNGAIRKSSIDLATADEDINTFLENTIHRPPPSTSDPEVDLGAQCWHECCSKCPYSLTLDAMLQNFSDALSQHNVKPGNLLSFKSDFTSRSIVCLLGVTLQKPKLQTLMCARFNATDRVEFVLEDGIPKIPKICTARQLFKDYIDDFLQSASGLDDPTASKIQVEMEVWNHSVEWLEGSKLVAVANSLRHSWHISSSKRRVTKSAPGQLPFGMKMARKPRESKPRVKKTAVKKKPPAKEKPEKPHIFDGNESPEIIDSDSDACAESDSSTLSSTSDNEEGAPPWRVSQLTQFQPRWRMKRKEPRGSKRKWKNLKDSRLSFGRNASLVKFLLAFRALSSVKKSAWTMEQSLCLVGVSVCNARLQYRKGPFDLLGFTIAFDLMDGCTKVAWSRWLKAQTFMSRSLTSLVKSAARRLALQV